MIHPLFADTVTLYQKTDDRYARHVLSGVQWRQKLERYVFQRGQTGVFDVKAVTGITIPAAAMGRISVSPSEGDVFVLGIGPELTGEYTIAKLKAEFSSYCTVRAVTDNTLRPKLRHWKVVAL